MWKYCRECAIINRYAAAINNRHLLDNNKILMYFLYSDIDIFLA